MSRKPEALDELARVISRPPYRPPPQASKMATASLICGVAGFVTCGLTSLVGLILGIMALLFIRDSDGQLGGRNVAITGVVLSSVMAAAFILLLIGMMGSTPLRWLGL